MADSFIGTALNILWNPSISEDYSADVSIRHIPGGNTSYIDSAGQTPRQITLSLRWDTYANHASFAALRGSYGTLVYINGTVSISALLLSYSLGSYLPGGKILAQAVFVQV